MKLSALLAIAAVIGGSFLIPNPANAGVKAALVEVHPGNTPGIYTAIDAYGRTENGKAVEVIVKVPLLLNCRNATYAYYNHKTNALSISPIKSDTRQGRLCIRRYGWFGD